MDNKEFAQKLEDRTGQFAAKIIKLSGKLPNTPEGRVIRNQLTKAGTSIGANYREANRARSKADFSNKIRICEGEASETRYWLRVITESGMMPATMLESEYSECGELLAIFAAIGRSRKPETPQGDR